MPSSIASGTQSASVATEHTLTTQTDAHNYQLDIDLSNLAAGDTVEIRVFKKVLSSGAYKLVRFYSKSHTSTEAVLESPPCSSLYGIQVTLKQTAGTGRDFAWNLRTLD